MVIKRVARVYGPEKRVFAWAMHDVSVEEPFKKITYSSKPHFYEKLFLKSEIDYCLRFKNSAERFAGKFAAKEAVLKSVSGKISFLDIETSHSNDKPIVKLRNKKQKYSFLVSISHEKNFAISVVISKKI